MNHFDVAIIGAGFGGLSCALTLAERGAKVAIFERLTYPGGCASTFQRKGYRFESGATLFSGFGEGQLFSEWIDLHQMDVRFQTMDPVVELRAGPFVIRVPPQRERLIEQFCAFDGAPRSAIRAFFEWQEKVADALWGLFDDPTLLPPFSLHSIFRHIRRSPKYLPLLTAVGQSVGDILRRHQLENFAPIRAYMDAVCQITVQTSADEAEAPFALAAMDYFFRGTGHIHGGIGQLATALSDTITNLGGQVSFADPVWKLRRTDNKWTITSRRQTITADKVVANLLPANLSNLLGDDSDAEQPLEKLSGKVEKGWGAAMLYLGLDRENLDNKAAHHIEMIDDIDTPFIEGNHLFCSISGSDEPERAPTGQRVATISTHVKMDQLWKGEDACQAKYIDEIHRRMRSTLRLRAPEVAAANVFEMTASPRTFERFTNRHQGYVGGIPRDAGLHHYLQFAAPEVDRGLYMVGDTVFPGQSTLAVSLGGLRLAETIG